MRSFIFFSSTINRPTIWMILKKNGIGDTYIKMGRGEYAYKMTVLKPKECALYLLGDLAALRQKVIFKKQFGFQVLRMVTMKSTVFWYITTKNPIEVHQRF
jgi:hypothetical protein